MIRCGHCKGAHRTVAAVRLCAFQEAEAEATYRAETYAEGAWLRYAESAGEDDPHERELWALEDLRREMLR